MTDNPLADFERHDAEQAKAEAKRPVCYGCKEAIWADKAVLFRGHYYCDCCEDEAWELIRKELITYIVEE